MPLNTAPGASALLYARNKATGETYYVGPSTPGLPYVIVGDFGEQHVPADLPVDGAIPADWDAVGDQAHQMVVGEGLVYSPFDLTVADAGYLFSFVGAAETPTGWVRAGRVTGPAGPTGVSSVIVGDFGVVTTPADLPPDGLIPIDWDGPGNPAAAFQMEQGWSLYYEKPTDTTLDGHLFQYVGTGIDASGWLDIGLIQGPTGAAGPEGPQGIQGEPGAPLVPSVATPAVLLSGFTGALVFRTNGAAVTMSLNNVKRSSVHGDGQIKICDYPAGITAPVEVQQVINHGMTVKSNGYIDLHTANWVLVRARPDGVFLAIMSNGPDFGTGEALNCQMTWVV
jgi:hypothetical protein